MNQRFLELPLTASSPGAVTVAAPASAADCPPGHYLLFVLNSQGVPSEARTVSIGNSACGAAVSVSTGLTPLGCSAVAEATAIGTNLNADYRWSIDGVYQPALDGRPTVSVNLDNCRPQVTFAVAATSVCGGGPVSNFGSVSGGPFTSSNGAICDCAPQE